MLASPMPPNTLAPHRVRYVLPAGETIVETAVAAQEDTAGVDIGVVEEVGGGVAGRRTIAATFVLCPLSKVNGNDTLP